MARIALANAGVKTGRNDPCTCGSGRKYKQCCGAPKFNVRVERPSMRAARTARDQGSPRPCGECSACCGGWLKTRVLGHDIDVGKPCPYSSGHDCTIHPRRPEDPCRIFFCGWAESGSQLPEWMQPNQSGVIVLTRRSSWRGIPVDVLVSAGRDPDERLLAWYQRYSKVSLRPFIYQLGEYWYGYGPPAFQSEIAAKAAHGEALWT